MRLFKKCSACALNLPLESFNIRRASGDGRGHKCRACEKIYRSGRKERYKELRRAHYERNKDTERNRALEYYHAHRESLRAKHIEYMVRTADQQREYRKRKNADYVARTARRRAEISQRTPKWVNDEDLKAMQYIYRTAQQISKLTGMTHHVDHEIPLRGKRVSGLHVPSNLRIIQAEENLSKGNRYDPHQ